MNIAITLTRIILVLLIAFNLVGLFVAENLAQYGVVIFGLAVLFVFWWLTLQIKSKVNFKDLLPKIWIILGLFIMAISVFGIALIFLESSNASVATLLGAALAGGLLIRIGVNRE